MTEIDELEPCPFCSARLIEASDPRMAGMVMHPAGLPLCPIGALHFLPTPELVAAWNRRPSLSPTGVTEEQVEVAARVMAEGLYEGKEAWGEYRAIARAALEAAAKAQPSISTGQGESVGVAGSMPGTDGFTLAAFEASKVPVGTKLYTHPSLPAGHVAVPVEPTEADIRICPRRDSPCPHGMSCTYWQVDMGCSTEPRAAIPHNQGEGK